MTEKKWRPEHNRFVNLDFEAFRKLAEDGSLSRHEKVGFPDFYREGKEARIFQDIRAKLPNLDKRNQVILDIGPGCSGPALMLVDLCRANQHELILVDSAEMLAHLPDEPFIRKIAAYYPGGCLSLFDEYAGRANAILTYSVLHYVFVESNIFDFLDRSLSLLAEGGEMLIGDIPNASKRNRYFASRAGIRFHQDFTGTDEVPEAKFNSLRTREIDDAVITALLLRCRNSGFDAYWVPQPDDLPMANRREDVLIRKA
jgi:hypothetical protein